MFRILIGAAIGLLAGALVGYIGKARGGTCPLACNPYGGSVTGALIGAVIAWTGFGAGRGDSKLFDRIPSANSAAQFDKAVLRAARPVLVDFYTPQCGFCRQLAPTIGLLARQYAGKADFVKVDGNQAADLVGTYRIEGYPTVMVFARGRPVKRLVGLEDESAYRAALEEALAGFGPAPDSQPARQSAQTGRTTPDEPPGGGNSSDQ